MHKMTFKPHCSTTFRFENYIANGGRGRESKNEERSTQIARTVRVQRFRTPSFSDCVWIVLLQYHDGEDVASRLFCAGLASDNGCRRGGSGDAAVVCNIGFYVLFESPMPVKAYLIESL